MLTYCLIRLGSQRSRCDERGASAVEYGLLLAGIAAVIVLAVVALGGTVRGLFDETGDCIAARSC